MARLSTVGKGIYAGAKKLGARKDKAFSVLAEVIKDQQRKFEKGMGKRKLWDLGGDILKKFFPGAGHIADFAIDQISSRAIKDIGDPAKIRAQKSGWLGGVQEEEADEFQRMKDEVDPDKTLGADLLSQVVDFAGTKAGEAVAGKIKGKFQNWKGLKDNPWLEADDGWGDFLTGAPQDSYGMAWTQKDLFGNPVSMEEGGQVPTISEYFSNMGKTLDGNDKQSLAEKLGRR